MAHSYFLFRSDAIKSPRHHHDSKPKSDSKPVETPKASEEAVPKIDMASNTTEVVTHTQRDTKTPRRKLLEVNVPKPAEKPTDPKPTDPKPTDPKPEPVKKPRELKSPRRFVLFFFFQMEEFYLFG